MIYPCLLVKCDLSLSVGEVCFCPCLLVKYDYSPYDECLFAFMLRMADKLFMFGISCILLYKFFRLLHHRL